MGSAKILHVFNLAILLKSRKFDDCFTICSFTVFTVCCSWWQVLPSTIEWHRCYSWFHRQQRMLAALTTRWNRTLRMLKAFILKRQSWCVELCSVLICPYLVHPAASTLSSLFSVLVSLSNVLRQMSSRVVSISSVSPDGILPATGIPDSFVNEFHQDSLLY